jgi:hypothetical protein
MKPANKNINIGNRSGRDNRGQNFPVTDYNYQPNGCADRGHCGPRFGTNGPSFRGISNDYFAREARHNFAAEGTIFAVIVMTAALPILNSATALFHFLHSTGSI